MLFSRRKLRLIIIPLLIEQALAVTIGMADSIMVASAGESAVSGVSLVDTVNLLLFYLFSALAGGGSVVISQLIGQKNVDRAKEASKQLVYLVFAVSLSLAIFTLLFRVSLLKLIFGSVSAEVMENAKIYFLFTAISYPFLGIYHAGASVYRAMGNTKISMTSSIIMNLLNIFGNAMLIYGFKMGAMGAGIATLFARTVGAFIMLILVCDKKQLVHVKKLFRYKPNFILIKQICRIGVPNGLEHGMFQFGKVITQSVITLFGTVQIAANAVASSLTSLQYIPGTAIGHALITVVGTSIGANEKEEAKIYTRKLVKLTYAIIFLISLVLCLLPNTLIGFYGLSSESSAIAKKIIITHSIMVCTIWPISFTLPNAFRAASDVKFPMIIAVISMWIFRVGFSFILAVHFKMGVMGVWVAMFMDWLFRAIIFMIRYFRKTWLKKYHGLT